MKTMMIYIAIPIIAQGIQLPPQSKWADGLANRSMTKKEKTPTQDKRILYPLSDPTLGWCRFASPFAKDGHSRAAAVW